MRFNQVLSLLVLLTSYAIAEQVPSKFSLSSPSFSDQGKLPLIYTCDGSNLSPPLHWMDPPANTKTFALIVSDPDAPNGTFYHWVLYNIQKSDTGLPEGMKTLSNGTMGTTYKGACPPQGAPHHYIFTLYALDAPLVITEGVDAKTVLAAMQGHILSKATLTATYGH